MGNVNKMSRRILENRFWVYSASGEITVQNIGSDSRALLQVRADLVYTHFNCPLADAEHVHKLQICIHLFFRSFQIMRRIIITHGVIKSNL